MIVPYADLKGQYATLREEILAALDRVGSKAAFILGEEVQEFEREFAQRATSPFPVEPSHFESGLKDGESRWVNRLKASRFWGRSHTLVPLTQNRPRSEERRVGEECRSPRAPD